MINYIDGAIREGIERAKALMSKIPRAAGLGLYFTSLATVANNEIQIILEAFDHLYNDADFSDARNLRQKFFRFKLLSQKLAEIENVVIAAMNRKTSDDEYINKMVFEICKEINYPLQHPVASCLSQKYYHIYPSYNLLCVPLLEADFVLHLPDIYHELGHPLIEMDNPKVDSFKTCLGQFNAVVRKYFDDEIQRRNLSKMVDPAIDPLLVYKDSWLENWSSELFCDLFGTFTLGPAYAWSNIHMCAKMSWDVYRLPTLQKTTHPPDEARMKAILMGLDILGCNEDAADIHQKWEAFKELVGQKKGPDFATALPESLLRQAAEFCRIGTEKVECTIYAPGNTGKVNTLLNVSWKQFWKDPKAFPEWEKQALQAFRASI
jgi:hypothetical protein